MHFNLSMIFKAYSLFVDDSLHNLTTAKLPETKYFLQFRYTLPFSPLTVPYRPPHRIFDLQGMRQNDIIILTEFLQQALLRFVGPVQFLLGHLRFGSSTENKIVPANRFTDFPYLTRSEDLASSCTAVWPCSPRIPIRSRPAKASHCRTRKRRPRWQTVEVDLRRVFRTT